MDVYVKVYKIASSIEDPNNAGNIAGGKTIDEIPLLDVAEFGSVKKYLEEDATEFRMDSISLKTEFLPKGYFDDYDPQSPYLLEAQVGTGWDAGDSRCIFYGPIKKKSIKYNERTEVTSFEASSWARSVKRAGRMIARDRIPVKIAKTWQRGSYEGTEGDEFMHVVGTDSSIDSTLEPGAVVNTKGKVGDADIDMRFVVTSTPQQDGSVEGNPVYKFRVATGAEDLVQFGPVQGFDMRWRYERVNDPRSRLTYDYWWAQEQGSVIGAPVAEVGDISESAKGARIQIKADGEVIEARVENVFRGPKLDGPEQKVSGLKTSNVERGEYVWFELDTRLAGKGISTIDNDPLERFPEGSSNNSELPGTIAGTWSLNKRMRVDSDEEGTLYSSDAYGQGGQSVEPYSAIDLAEGIATRTPALADLLDNSPIVLGTPGEITRMYEFPDKGIKALGQIQRSSETQLLFEPRSADGAGGERKNNGARRVKMVAKTRHYLAGQAAVDLPGALEWKGEALGAEPDAVLVRGPDPINVAIERDESHGWWPEDEIDTPDSAKEGGKEIIEIELPLVQPTIEGDDAFGVPKNVPTLSGRARRYYDFYSSYYREKEAVVDGVIDSVPGGDFEESMLGQLVSEDESVLESGIVKGQEVDYRREETTLTLMVSDQYTAPANAAPVALLRGPEYVIGSGGTASVFLDATACYDPNGDPVSLEWEKNGSLLTGETGRFYEGSISDGDTITVVATDPDGATDSDSITFTVLPESDSPPDENRAPQVALSLDPSASSATTSVFNIEAWERGAEINVYYLVTNWEGQVDSGTIGSGSELVVDTLSVTRPSSGKEGSKELEVVAQDGMGNMTTATHVVQPNQAPEILNATVDPTVRSGGAVNVYVDLDDQARWFDLDWEVRDDTGSLVGSDHYEDVDTGEHGGERTFAFYIDEPPAGGSGHIKVTPQGSPGLAKWLLTGETRTWLIGPPESETDRFSLLGGGGGVTTTVSDPNNTLEISEDTGVGGVSYEISAPQGIDTTDTPKFIGVEVDTGKVAPRSDGGVEIRTSDDSGFAPVSSSVLKIAGDGSGPATLDVVTSEFRVQKGGTPALNVNLNTQEVTVPQDFSVGGSTALQDVTATSITMPSGNLLMDTGYLWIKDNIFYAEGGGHIGGSSVPEGTLDVSGNLIQASGYHWVKQGQLYVGDRTHLGGSSYPAETLRVSGDETVTGIGRIGSWASVADKMAVGASAPYGPNAPGTEQLQVDGSVGTYGVNFYGAGSWNVRSSGGTGDLLIHQNFGSNYSVLEARTSDVDVTDTTANSEATLALTRSDSAENNVEFIDLYNNGYHTSNSVRYGLRVQRRGQGKLRRFAFEWSDGQTKPVAYNLYPPGDLVNPWTGVDPALFEIYAPTRFGREVESDQGIVAESYNVSTLGGSGYVLRRKDDNSTQLYSDEIVANTFRVAEFLVNQITFSASQAISAGFVARAPIQDNGGGNYTVGADTNPTVAQGDLVRAKRYTDGSHDSKARVDTVTRNGSDSTVNLQLVDNNGSPVSPSTSNNAPQPGFQYARIGNVGSAYGGDDNRQNLIYLTASDASNPRIDFYEDVDSFGSFGASTLSTRVGNLDGLSKAQASGMGLFTEQLRATGDAIIGDLTAGAGDSYLKFNSNGLKVVTTATGDLDTAISSIESIVGDGTGMAQSTLTLTANQNTTDIGTNASAIATLEAKVGTGAIDAASTLTLAANSNTTEIGTNASAISSLESIVGDGTGYSKATLTLQASQNETEIGTNASAISSLEAQVGSGAIDAGSSLTLAANQNTTDIGTNASAVATLEAQVGTGSISAGSSLTLAANQNTGDIDNNASAVATLEAQVGTGTIDAAASLTAAANSNTAELDLTVRYDDSSAGILVEANATSTAITLDADTTLVGKLEGPSSEYTINLDTGTFLLNQGSIADSVTIGGVGAEQIRRGGLTFQSGFENGTQDWTESFQTFIDTFTGNSVWSGEKSAVFRSHASTSSSSSGTTDGVYTEIPEEIALEFAGRTVEVTLWVKEAATNPSTSFAVAYSTADAGNSGWQTFTPTSNWQPYRFTYDVPEPGSGGTDYLGILGDADGGPTSIPAHGVDVDRVTIRPQTKEISGFKIGARRIERYDSNGNLDTAIGRDLQDVDAPNTVMFGEYLGEPVLKLTGGGGKNTDYVYQNGSSSGVMFDIKSGGNTIMKVEDGQNTDPSVFIDNLDLKDLDITGTIKIIGGKITNNLGDYEIDGQGITLFAGKNTLARRISWKEGGDEVARMAADNGTIETIVNGDQASGQSGMAWYAKAYSTSTGPTDRMKMGMAYRPTGNDGIEFRVSNVENYFTDGYPEIKLGHMPNDTTGTYPRGFNFYPNEGLMHFQNPRNADPSQSKVRDICDKGEFVLYAYEEGDGDVRLKYAEHKPSGAVDYKTIRD